MIRERNPRVLSCSTLTGETVYNSAGEKLGSLEEIMLDLSSGRVAYAVLSFGGILGIGDKLFAIPWSALHIDTDNKRILFDVPKETLERAPGFDKSNWPDFASEEWGAEIHGFYGQTPYWETSAMRTEGRRDVSETGLGDVEKQVRQGRREEKIEPDVSDR